MSSGFRSAMRLTGESCMIEPFPPRLDLVTAKMPEGIATLLTIIPSTTKSGSASPLIDETPRRRTCAPPPERHRCAGCWRRSPCPAAPDPRSAPGSPEVLCLDGRHRHRQVPALGPRGAAGHHDLLRKLLLQP